MRLKLNIINHTSYKTSDLRAVLKRTHRKFYNTHGKLSYVNVVVKPGRNSGVSGYAWYHQHDVVLKISNKYEPDVACVARVAYHEMLHCIGWKHEDMADRHQYALDVSFVEGMCISKVVKEKKSAPTVIDNISKLESRKKTWLSKLKRAENAIKKIDKKIKYYKNKALPETNENVSN